MADIEQIDANGNFTHHCDNPDCTHHNCANWPYRTCPHHAPHERVKGQTHQYHISHAQVQWISGREVALPPCHCGTNGTIMVSWSDKELAPPVITRDDKGNITSVLIVGAPNFTRVRTHLEKRTGQDGQEYLQEVIDGVDTHPAIATHQELARQLQQAGKVWTPPQ